ncbi:hypothetical protein QBC34DRAFT_198342 [Podospora aff. communis PSN243]|uniref:Uncharacterized protein n=1 Tax=Podospora aff. communis PSN243 TaxID=3040156 RepID=A0AAV9G6R1_9PEZI|nr:hypothetical protein QBC34DRAFT_198342 [Podospora aff. communis PSN243]
MAPLGTNVVARPRTGDKKRLGFMSCAGSQLTNRKHVLLMATKLTTLVPGIARENEAKRRLIEVGLRSDIDTRNKQVKYLETAGCGLVPDRDPDGARVYMERNAAQFMEWSWSLVEEGQAAAAAVVQQAGQPGNQAGRGPQQRQQAAAPTTTHATQPGQGISPWGPAFGAPLATQGALDRAFPTVPARHHDVLAELAKKYVDTRFRSMSHLLDHDRYNPVHLPASLQAIYNKINRTTTPFHGLTNDPRATGRQVRTPGGGLRNWDFRTRQINIVSAHGSDLESDLVLVENRRIIEERHGRDYYEFFRVGVFEVLYPDLNQDAARWLIDKSKFSTNSGPDLAMTVRFMNHVTAYTERMIDDVDKRMRKARAAAQPAPLAETETDVKTERDNNSSAMRQPWRGLMMAINRAYTNCGKTAGPVDVKQGDQNGLVNAMRRVYNVMTGWPCYWEFYLTYSFSGFEDWPPADFIKEDFNPIFNPPLAPGWNQV